MKQIDPPVDATSLIDVQLAFTHWRNTRTIREPTPDRLRGLAVDLLCRYKYVTVSEVLPVRSAFVLAFIPRLVWPLPKTNDVWCCFRPT